jgi:predicted DCC family thiol-disulfide oxidoreductase YuxK
LNRPTPTFHLHNVIELQNIGDRLLVIYDGHCGLCNRSIRWFLRHDRHDRLRFTPSDSPNVAYLLARHGLDATTATPTPNTILVVENAAQFLNSPAERLLTHSDAVVAILRQLPQPWPTFATILRMAPRPLRDLGYRLIARFRYRIWGRLDTCPIPTSQERSRFL